MATQRIAINCGGGYVPGLNGVVVGAALAARRLGWEVVGIHDGYDGLLVPESYPDGGLITFDVRTIDGLDAAAASSAPARATTRSAFAMSAKRVLSAK